MKMSVRRVALLATLLAPASAFAHPGHEGDHDFTWTFSHLVDHPLATLSCFALIATGALIAWRLATWAERAAPAPVRSRN